MKQGGRLVHGEVEGVCRNNNNITRSVHNSRKKKAIHLKAHLCDSTQNSRKYISLWLQ